MTGLSRRTFLSIASLLVPVARLRAGGRQTAPPGPGLAPISVQDFLALSQRLVGRTTLDVRMAATYLTALLAVPANIPLLAHLAGRDAPDPSRAPELLALEQTIIEWWYTGIYTLGGERRVGTHVGALMWDALGVRSPGTCTSAFGAWSRAPGRAA